MITSKTVIIPYIEDITTEYIENQLKELNINNVLRWALVHSNKSFLKVNVAYEE